MLYRIETSWNEKDTGQTNMAFNDQKKIKMDNEFYFK